jgi:ArsR family transcriptional regulator
MPKVAYTLFVKTSLTPNLPHDPELESFLRRHISADGQVIEPEPEEEAAPATPAPEPAPELPPAAATVFRALAHPDRLRIIDLLEHDELSVTAINDQLELSQAHLSKHLAVLRRAGLVSRQTRSTARYYRLNDPDLPAKARAIAGVV